ncbi:zinc finger, CCHC-type containing protein [Tanacetum coccineum]
MVAAAPMKHMASNFSKADKLKGWTLEEGRRRCTLTLQLEYGLCRATPINDDGGDDAIGNNQERGPSRTMMTMFAEVYSPMVCLIPCLIFTKMLNLPKNYRIPWRPSIWLRMPQARSSLYNDNKGKHKHQDTKADPNKKSKVTCWKCGKPGHLKKDCKGGKVGNKANGSGTNGSVDGSTNSLKGATMHVCKDRCWFKTYESLNDGSILHMGNESTALVHGRGCVDLRFSSGNIVLLDIVNDNIGLSQGFLCEVIRLHDPKLKTLGERGIECIFVGYAKHFKAFRFYVIEPNKSVSINSIIESRDAIFGENRFSSVPRPSLRIPNGTGYIGGSVDDPKTFDEAMKSQDVAFWKGDHTFEVEPQENVDQGVGLQEVQTQDLMDYQLARDRDQHLACELFGYREGSNEAAFVVAAVEKIYAAVEKIYTHESLTFNDTVDCEAEMWVTKGLLVKAKGNVLGLEIIRDQSGNTLRVSQSRIHKRESWV